MACNAVGCCVPGFIFCVLAFMALCVGILMEWTNGVNQFGIFKICLSAGSCQWRGFVDPSASTELFITQVLAVASGSLTMLAVCLGMVPMASGFFQLFGGACGEAAVILFGVDQFNNGPLYGGWAFWTTAGASALLIVNGLALMLTACCTRRGCQVTFGPCAEGNNKVYPISEDEI